MHASRSTSIQASLQLRPVRNPAMRNARRYVRTDLTALGASKAHRKKALAYTMVNITDLLDIEPENDPTEGRLP